MAIGIFVLEVLNDYFRNEKGIVQNKRCEEIIKKDIEAMLNILDSNYGTERNYFREGGFVSIVGTVDDFHKLFSDWKIDLKNDISEYSIHICGYIKKLFILNSDFAIITYTLEELL